jgi:2-polyprenyl-6-hydroxyphenyl methylase/3-demethylubiquinone-9 3-methyltransferase
MLGFFTSETSNPLSAKRITKIEVAAISAASKARLYHQISEATMTTKHSAETKSGERFQFGKNWAQFLNNMNDERVELAQESLRNKLKLESLSGKRFLDIGSGSGLFSLAARKLGAVVHSLDYDPQSVACTEKLKSMYCPDDSEWTIEQGSALDQDYLNSLGKWDVVYSWGVLHHTGNMDQALENVSGLVEDDGILFISIYNDQGRKSRSWLKIKKLYNKTPKGLRWAILIPMLGPTWGPTVIYDFTKGRPFHTWRNYTKVSLRGMNPWRDLVDWVGGLPFEVATPEKIFRIYRDRGFQLLELTTNRGGYGCNEFVFRKIN